MYTFVTAFVDLNELEPRPSTKSRRIYLDMAESLLTSGMNFVCFCQPEHKSELETIAQSNGNSTYIVDVKLSDFRRKHDKIFFAELPTKRNPLKDTHWYLAITHHKIHWMQQAAKINPFNARYFCWIDFGINHMMHARPERFNELLRTIDSPREGEVICGSFRTPNVATYEMRSYVNDFSATHLAGAVLAMRNSTIEWFATQQDKIIVEILACENVATWEATVWGIMAHRFPERFRAYEATGWDESLLINFPRRLSNCSSARSLKICHVSTLPPTQCGIADYTAMLMANLRSVQSSTVEIVLGNDSEAEDGRHIRLDHPSDYGRAADWINNSDIEVVSLQHEFGIYGGPFGADVLLLLERIRKPVVVTLHTTQALQPGHTDVVVKLGRQADALVTLTELSKRSILSNLPEANVHFIPHGIPEVQFCYPEAVPVRAQFGDDFVFISAGHINTQKGIDRAVMALGKLRQKRSDFRYLIVGKEHPQALTEAAFYRNRVLQLIDELNLGDHVIHVNEFLDLNKFLEYILSADVGLALYDDLAQCSSGIVPTILGCGRPVIATPFEYVRATKDFPGLYVAPSKEVDDSFRMIDRLIENKDALRSEMPLIYDATRHWIWDRIAGLYMELFERVRLNRVGALAAKRSAMRSDRDAAFGERDAARAERDTARAERDQARKDADPRALPRRALRKAAPRREGLDADFSSQ